MADEINVARARIEQIKPLADEYRLETAALATDGQPWNPPLPQGGVFWLATDAETKEPLGYAAGRLRPEGCTIGPVFVRDVARRRGVGNQLLVAIQEWANDTRVPVVEISLAPDNEPGRKFLESLGYVPRRLLMSLTPENARKPG